MKFFRIGLASILVLATAAVFAMGESFVSRKNPLIGTTAPDFTLKLLGGSPTTLTQHRGGQKAVIFFWATWCPHCREALREINPKMPEFERKGIRIILVDVGETEKEVRDYVIKNKIPFDVFLDGDSRVSKEYRIIGVPTFFFINSTGKIVEMKHQLPENYEEILSQL